MLNTEVIGTLKTTHLDLRKWRLTECLFVPGAERCCRAGGAHSSCPGLGCMLTAEDVGTKYLNTSKCNIHIVCRLATMRSRNSFRCRALSAAVQVVRILHAQGVDFSSINILDYPAIREGVKKFSDWPTIPQVYLNGEFVGGCDIMTQMHKSGELETMLKEAGLVQAK
eukprot:TRINITY_DN2422_c0_g1_i1.p2 TRINITY_DN2422_c0_g1~~TRINITY_DN2422_c0_g1_i1.p2  ORF type:complete len:168 (-),score=22.65 TRINITY_DN2422_c0_g1_i1:57-560(-)